MEILKFAKNWEFPIFCSKNDQKFWEFPWLLYLHDQKKSLMFWEFPLKNVGEIWGDSHVFFRGVYI